MLRTALLLTSLLLPPIAGADEIDDLRRELRHDEATKALEAAIEGGDAAAAARLAVLTLEAALVERVPSAKGPQQLVIALEELDLAAHDEVTLARLAFFHGDVVRGEAALGRARDLDGGLKAATDRVLAKARDETLPNGGYFRYRGHWLPLAERDRERLFDYALEALWNVEPDLQAFRMEPTRSNANRAAFEQHWAGTANDVLRQRAERARGELAADYETVRSWLPSYDAGVPRGPMIASLEALASPRATLLALIASYDKPAQGEVDAQRAALESAYRSHLQLLDRDWRELARLDSAPVHALLERIRDREAAIGHVHRYLAAHAGSGLPATVITPSEGAATTASHVLPGREHSGLEDVLWLVVAHAAHQHLDVMARSAELARNPGSLTPWERLVLGRVRQLSIKAYNDRVATSLDGEERACCQTLDAYRAVLGLEPLEIEERLVVAARGHSQEMADLGYFGHVSPVERLRFPTDRARLEGYTGGVGENCFAGGSTGEGAFEAWYHSPGHHRLMVATGPQIGVGAAGGATWTMLVGGTDLTWRSLHQDMSPIKARSLAQVVAELVESLGNDRPLADDESPLSGHLPDALPMLATEAFAAVNARSKSRAWLAPDLLRLIVEADVPVAWRALQVAAVAASIDIMEHADAGKSRTTSFALVRPLLTEDHGYDPSASRRKRLPAVQAVRREWEDSAQLRYRAEGLDAKAREALLAASTVDGPSRRSALRALTAKERRKLAKKHGGGDDTEDAVEAGLAWLASVQDEDGGWRAKSFALHVPNADKVGKELGQGNAEWEVAMTGLALLAFSSAGHTTEQGDYTGPVGAGARFLTERVTDYGRFATSSSHYMYSHAIATQALCELYAYGDDPVLGANAQATLDFLMYAQDEGTGGWRYEPNEAGDTSVTGWVVMALNAGHKAELEVGGLREGLRFLDSVTSSGYYEMRYTPSGQGGTNRLGAIGALCRMFLTGEVRDGRVTWNGRRMLNELPAAGKEDYYYWYYGSLVMFQLAGDFWEEWHTALKPAILSVQTTNRQSPVAGSWPARGAYANNGGRVMQTALAVLMLTTYYRYDREREAILRSITGDVAKLAAPQLEVILGAGDDFKRSVTTSKLIDEFGVALAPVLIRRLRTEGTPVEDRKRLAALLVQVAREQHEIVVLELLANETEGGVRAPLTRALDRICSANSVNALATQLDNEKRDVRVIAARMLGRLAVPAAAVPLGARLGAEKDQRVRTEIEKALTALTSPGPVVTLVDAALKQKDPRRLAVMDGLSTLSRDELARELVAEQQHDAKLYKSFLAAIRKHGDEAGIPVLLLALESERIELRTLAAKLLTALTGTTRGYAADDSASERRKSLREWAEWWSKVSKGRD